MGSGEKQIQKQAKKNVQIQASQTEYTTPQFQEMEHEMTRIVGNVNPIMPSIGEPPISAKGLKKLKKDNKAFVTSTKKEDLKNFDFAGLGDWASKSAVVEDATDSFKDVVNKLNMAVALEKNLDKVMQQYSNNAVSLRKGIDAIFEALSAVVSNYKKGHRKNPFSEKGKRRIALCNVLTEEYLENKKNEILNKMPQQMNAQKEEQKVAEKETLSQANIESELLREEQNDQIEKESFLLKKVKQIGELFKKQGKSLRHFQVLANDFRQNLFEKKLHEKGKAWLEKVGLDEHTKETIEKYVFGKGFLEVTYITMNGLLRTGEFEKRKAEMEKDELAYDRSVTQNGNEFMKRSENIKAVDALQKAIAQSELEEDMALMRHANADSLRILLGYPGDHEFTKEDLKNIQERIDSGNCICMDPGFVSTTAFENGAPAFNFTKYPVEFRILAHKGTSAAYMEPVTREQRFIEEKEMLLNSGQKMRLLKLEPKANNKYIVYMETINKEQQDSENNNE